MKKFYKRRKLLIDIYKQNYQNLSKPAHIPNQIYFYRRFFQNQKVPGTSYNIIISRTKRASEVK